MHRGEFGEKLTLVDVQRQKWSTSHTQQGDLLTSIPRAEMFKEEWPVWVSTENAFDEESDFFYSNSWKIISAKCLTFKHTVGGLSITHLVRLGWWPWFSGSFLEMASHWESIHSVKDALGSHTNFASKSSVG